ncbi:MAG TPA: acyl-CoA dehydrogenase family protein [Chloroflexia bacterium]|nr:acyl-CoA dehydrogenase family protein [Chloroflexia bacterium]
MEFGWSTEQRMIQDLARTFAAREIRPVAAQYDHEAQFPRAIYDQARALGLLNLTIPVSFGGAGLGALELALVTEQLGWGCTGIASALGINALVGDALLVGGSPAQQATYLGRLVAGELGCYAVTEPGAGSDVAAMTTRARRDGDTYVLDGSKIWISNAPEAAFAIIFARTDPAAGHRGLSAFVVERDTPGLEIGGALGKLGQKAAPAAPIHLTACAVPARARLGAEGDGFRIAMAVFDRSRPMVAALATGLLARCLDESLTYAKTRQTMGRPILEHQAVGHKIAAMGQRLAAARLLTYQAAWLLDTGARNTLQAAYAKAFAADSAMWAATEAIQVFGGMGYSTEYPVEKLFRDAKVLQIYEGTSEIQHNIMIRELAR